MTFSNTLDAASLQAAANDLAASDPAMARALEVGGRPKLWKRTATFASFIRIILEQQVSLASAWRTYERLQNACDGGRVTPVAVLTLGDETLRSLGFSRQKARYTLALADDCRSGRFKIASLRHQSDDEVRARIIERLGMGHWTADMFLLLALCRRDVFPPGDLAIVKGIAALDGVDYDGADALVERAQVWKPYRSVATRMIWGFYLKSNDRTLPF